VLLLQVATSLSFRFLVVMPFAGLSWGIFGGSPGIVFLVHFPFLALTNSRFKV
jgi:hypothetical protein